GARVRVKTERWLRLADDVDVAAALEGLRGARQRVLLEALADGPLAQAEALQESGASSGTVRSLVQRALVETYDEEVERTADEMSAPVGRPPEHTLHPSQARALAEIDDAIQAARPETFLLHGVTGSGKTEVYIRALTTTLLE